MIDPHTVFIAYTRTVRQYADVLCERELQPYEALMYQQLCRTTQTWAAATEEQIKRENANDLKRENDDLTADAADS